MNKGIFIIISLLLFVGVGVDCSGYSTTDGDQESNLKIVNNPHELLEAPETVTIDGKLIRLISHLNRDFMPPSPPDGQPLAVSVYLDSDDQTEVPPYQPKEIWVINRDSAWYIDEFYSAQIWPEGRLTWLHVYGANGGPKWGPRIYVDIIFRFLDSENHTISIQSKKHPIEQSF